MNKGRSWVALVALCTTRALAVALVSGVLFASATFVLAAAKGGKPVPTPESTTSKGRVFAGLITDSHCGARHDMDSGKNTMECTKMCVRNGSRYVLVEGDKRYELAGTDSEHGELRAHISDWIAAQTESSSARKSGELDLPLAENYS